MARFFTSTPPFSDASGPASACNVTLEAVTMTSRTRYVTGATLLRNVASMSLIWVGFMTTLAKISSLPWHWRTSACQVVTSEVIKLMVYLRSNNQASFFSVVNGEAQCGSENHVTVTSLSGNVSSVLSARGGVGSNSCRIRLQVSGLYCSSVVPFLWSFSWHDVKTFLFLILQRIEKITILQAKVVNFGVEKQTSCHT